MKRFRLVLIKPSHYDDDGYVIQWFRSAIPSNSLACLYGLALEAAENKILGDDTEIEIHAFDETNTVIKTNKIIYAGRKSGGRRNGDAGRRAVKSVSALARYRATVSQREISSRDRRFSCFRHDGDVQGARSATFKRLWIWAFRFLPAKLKGGSGRF